MKKKYIIWAVALMALVTLVILLFVLLSPKNKNEKIDSPTYNASSNSKVVEDSYQQQNNEQKLNAIKE
jgi:hypothetical protein